MTIAEELLTKPYTEAVDIAYVICVEPPLHKQDDTVSYLFDDNSVIIADTAAQIVEAN